MKEYKARKYIKDSGDPQIVTLRVEPQRLVVNGESGDESFNLSEFDLQLTGTDGDRIRLSHGPTETTFLITDKDVLKELEKSTALVAQKATKAHKKVRSLPALRMMYFGGIFGTIGAICAMFYFTYDFWVDKAMERIPPSAETFIGEIYADDEKLDGKSAMAKRVNTIGQRLVSHLDNNPYKFKFYIENKEQLNAYAVPGGTIVILKKLVNDAKSDDEIAGVIAHEIGHVKNRDTLRHLVHSGGIGMCLMVIFGGAASNEQVQTWIPALRALENLNYSRLQESSADETAILLTLKSGYNPEALIDLFARFGKEEPQFGKTAFAILSDHPMSDSRIALIKKESAEVREKLKAKGELAPPAPPVPKEEPKATKTADGGKAAKPDAKKSKPHHKPKHH